MPPSKGYGWLPGRAPWEIKILVAPPWLCDEIERLAAEHGGVVRGVPVSRPNTTALPRLPLALPS